jgi:thiol-disulfide isomerase/thioredoxin
MNPTVTHNKPALRRSLVLGAGAVGATAFVSGLALRHWGTQRQQADAALADKSTEQLAKLQQSASSALWTTQYIGVDGMAATLAPAAGQIMLVNFWATWCPPCVEELPMLSRFHEAQMQRLAAGKPAARLVAIAADKQSNVLNFIQKSPISGQVLIAGASAIELSKALGNLAGGLPFTLLIGRDGSISTKKLGQVKPADLEVWAKLIEAL